jgi:hypothetical protein
MIEDGRGEKEKEMENEHDNNIAKNGKTSSMSFTF